MQQLAVVRFIGDVVMDDQAAIDVDDALHVVTRRLGRMPVAHRPGVALAEDQHCLVAILQDLLPANQSILAATEGLDRIAERSRCLG